MPEEIINNSGNGQTAILPEELKGFNWGAFLLSWIWGIGNKAYITLLMLVAGFIPFVRIFAMIGLAIWFGFKGNEWAWQNKHFESIEHFKDNQKKWTIAGIILIIGSVLAMGALIAILAGAAISGTLQ